MTPVNSNTFNVVLRRDPYATVYVGDIVAVRVPPVLFQSLCTCMIRGQIL